MPAIQTTSNPYSSVTATQTSITACIAAAFAAITATNSNITLYQNASSGSTNYLVYACSNPIGSGTYNTVYLVIAISSTTVSSCALYETWNTSTFTGTNGIVNNLSNATINNFSNLIYTTYTDNSSYGIVSIYNTSLFMVSFGYIATASNNAFQSENILPSIVAFTSGGQSVINIVPTARTSTSSTGNAAFPPSFGTQGTNSYANNPVINYPIGINGIGSCSNDLGFTTYSFNFRDTVTIGSQVWTKVSLSGTNLGLFVRTT
jgi:hypothetical protein